MRHQHQVVIVTGGASGIGAATVRKFAAEGATVVLGDIQEEAGERISREIVEAGGKCQFHSVDTSSYESVEKLVQDTVSMHGKLDVMFNNAGIGNPQMNFLELSIEDYHRTVSVNQHGVYYGMRAAGLAMRAHGGVIVNTASIYGFIADRRQLPYHASKGAVVMMTKAAALELAKYDIRVVAVAPGLIDTNIVAGWKEIPDMWHAIERSQMRRKAGKPEDVANMVSFLASEEAKFMNGQVYFVDDGASSFKV